MSKIPVIQIGKDPLTLVQLEAIGRGRAKMAIHPEALERIARGRAVVDDVVAKRQPAYGITTGVGSQKDFAVDSEAIARFNNMLIIGHSTLAPGPSSPADVTKTAMALQLSLFATGRSGVRPALFEALLARLQHDDIPPVRLGASVGASDLVALGQMAVPLLGQYATGQKVDGKLPGGLQAKEALSLINSNCMMLAQGTIVLSSLRQLLNAATTIAAMTLEGFRGNPASWSAVVDAARGQPGQSAVGHKLRIALEESALWRAGEPRFLQDPLSIRCVPQIHGTAEAAYQFCADIFQTEINAICDNPMIDLDTGAFVSHGNMESSLCALGMDTLRLATAKLLEASGQRIHKIQWPSFTGLPQGLAQEGGVIGGVQFLNLAHIATANLALVCQNANPAILNYRGQVCDGVEDVGGVAPLSIAVTQQSLEAAWNVVTVEAICAAWAIDRRGVASSSLGKGLQSLYSAIRDMLPIGREGTEVFDMGQVADYLKAKFAEN